MRICFVMLAGALLAGGCGDREPAAATAATAAAALPAGQAIYQKYCYSCHAFGAAGAPKFGDRDAWAPRLAKGVEALVQSALNGVPPAMPAKGGLCIQCGEAEIRAAVEHMLSAVR